MKQYKVTLNFTFSENGCEVEEEYDDDGELISLEEEDNKQLEAFQRTDAYYAKHSVIEHIKSNDPMGFVESVFCDGEILSAEWDPKKFQIHMVVDTEMTKEEVIKDLEWNSLEDGEYEACGETGWLIFTRGPNDEILGEDGTWEMKNFWCYGLTDYRGNPIEVTELGKKEEIPKSDDLFTMTEKGKEIYKKMAALKLDGIRFSEEDENKFNVMKIVMNDKRLYPIGKA